LTALDVDDFGSPEERSGVAVAGDENWTSKAREQGETLVSSLSMSYHFHSILQAEEGWYSDDCPTPRTVPLAQARKDGVAAAEHDSNGSLSIAEGYQYASDQKQVASEKEGARY
jgi:hypothetical protein